jgi:hypothetical protein
VRDTVQFWLDAAGIRSNLVFAPYAQVLRQLLDGDGALGTGPDDVDMVLLRWEDWLRYQPDVAFADAVVALRRVLHELVTAVRVFRERCATPLVIGVCPPSHRFRQAPWDGAFEALTDRLVRLTAGHPATEVLRLDQPTGWPGVVDVCDPRADKLGHVPYTPEFFAVLGTAVAREVRRWHGVAPTVVAVDLAGAGDGGELLSCCTANSGRPAPCWPARPADGSPDGGGLAGAFGARARAAGHPAPAATWSPSSPASRRPGSSTSRRPWCSRPTPRPGTSCGSGSARWRSSTFRRIRRRCGT